MAIKLAAARGARVVAFTNSESKRADAHTLGAQQVVVGRNRAEIEAASCDLILDTVAAAHDLEPFLAALRRDGTLVLLGVPQQAHPALSARGLISARRTLAGSAIGGIAETQEMLDFWARERIAADSEPIALADARMLRGDVKIAS
ncbi:MAG: alcohol dehydrogenase [Pseudomonadota bacterium]|jgi:uncharacterized zinc-type alcohol dehydrogenase-like protein